MERYRKFIENKDIGDIGSGATKIENIAYLIRKTLENKGVDDFTVDYRGYDICVSLSCYKLERLNDIIKIFDVLQNIKEEILPQYDSEFDIYQIRNGTSVLEFNFFK